MEYIWYIIASVGAGIGTGLAGLSAATFMVPLLIVLCPSFSGETGAYQATAIALASDILGSAVTTMTYIKHKNIDLRRGGVMLACILSMCTVGSYAAWLAGNVVLGSFTLFLTVGIGIRFLVKPDSTRKNAVARGAKLDAKGIAVSLFFGLTIGFGTGFVGSGGGMMMLVVFTAFLGMELKTAVGTSTFIMTFTALIASVSHILIHPAILWERWNVLLLCVVLVTLSSRVSAKFANRVQNRTVGLVTGAVLLVMGIVLLTLHYRAFLSSLPYFLGTLRCLRAFVLYVLPCLGLMLLVYFFGTVPRFVFRKLLHMIAFSCVTFTILLAENWQSATLASVIIAAAVYPILDILEHESWFPKLFAEKRPGEVKLSLVLLFGMFAALTGVSWGLLNKPFAGAAAILMWGVGDAFAALIGIPFGRHKVVSRFTDGKKSYEGTFAMFLSSMLCGFLFLFLFCRFSAGISLAAALLGGIAGAVTELVSSSEHDTVTVPLMILLVLLPLL